MNKLKAVGLCYVSILVAYLLTDFLWLGVIARADYKTSIGHLMRESYPMWPWVAFYVVYSACILRLAIFNGKSPSFIRVLINSFTLGVASYGAYNLTNYAILESWPLSITMKDWIWGTCLTMFSASVGFFAYVWYEKKHQNEL